MTSSHSHILADDFRTFPSTLQGKARSRHHPEYAKWHKETTWNGRSFERYPEYIVRAGIDADIIRTVDFARSHGLSISVRGGGHSYGGCFLREGGILLDLSTMQEISVDATSSCAIVQPGVTSSQLSEALSEHGLAFPTGHGGGVAISGFLLGGGLGINSTAWGGMSVFNVTAMDVVTADGRIRHLSDVSETDLFWAARGAGPTVFFVVIRFYLRCWPLPRAITSNTYRAPFSKFSALLMEIERIQPDPRLQVMLAIVPTEDAPTTACGHEVMLNTIAFADSAPQAKLLHKTLVSQLEDGMVSPVEEDQATSFESIFRKTDAMLISKRYRTDNILTDRVEDAIRILTDYLPHQPSRASLPLIIWRGTHTFPNAAYSAQGRFFLSTYAQWDEASDDEANRKWLKLLYDDLETVASGCYINEFDIETRSADIGRCFSEESWQRLRELRRQYDPNGVFHDVATLSGDIKRI
jgi:FAD/FMN-containing dehydrogenase